VTENSMIADNKRDVVFDEAFIWIVVLMLAALLFEHLPSFVTPGIAEIVIAVTAVVVFLATKGSARKFGFTFSMNALKWLGIFILIMGTFYGILIAIALLTGNAEGLAADYFELEYILTMIIFAPVAEEILFRGFLFRALQNHFHFMFALIMSAVLFAVMHMVWGNVGLHNINHFIGGIVFALIYIKSRSLWASMILHSLGNTSLIILSVIL